MRQRHGWAGQNAERWFRERTFRAADIDALVPVSDPSVSVVLPALNEESTIGDICWAISSDLLGRTVDELIVVDSGSTDGTVLAAREAGAHVVMASDLLTGTPFIRGKGDVLWRSLSVARGDIVVWLDSDIENFDTSFVTRLVAPLRADPSLAFVKGFYDRPINGEPTGGGRVTELLARPLFNMMFPELSGFIQPLAGEYAARRDVVMSLPFMSGYSVEAAMLIDLVEQVGMDALAQVDLESRTHRNRPLDELAPMATAIASTIFERARRWGRIDASIPLAPPTHFRTADGHMESFEVTELERPPMRMGRPAAVTV